MERLEKMKEIFDFEDEKKYFKSLTTEDKNIKNILKVVMAVEINEKEQKATKAIGVFVKFQKAKGVYLLKLDGSTKNFSRRYKIFWRTFSFIPLEKEVQDIKIEFSSAWEMNLYIKKGEGWHLEVTI